MSWSVREDMPDSLPTIGGRSGAVGAVGVTARNRRLDAAEEATKLIMSNV